MTEEDPPYQIEEIPMLGETKMFAASFEPLTDEQKQKGMQIMRELLDDMKKEGQ